MTRLRKCILAGITMVVAAWAANGAAYADGAASEAAGSAEKAVSNAPVTDAQEKLLATFKAWRQKVAAAEGNYDPWLAAMDQQILILTAEIAAEKSRTGMEDVTAEAKQAAAQMTTAAKEGLDAFQAETAREKEAEKALQNKTVTLSFENAPLEKVLDAMREQLHCNMSIIWGTMRNVGIDTHTSMTVRLTDVSYDTALREVLATASESVNDPAFRLEFVVDKGLVCIGTREDFQEPRYQHVRMYNVRDLLEPPNAGSLTREEKAAAVAARVKQLQEILLNTIEPDTWRDNQGNLGTIQEYDGVLIINQSIKNHQAIASLFAQLRVAREGKDPLHGETNSK